MAKKQLKINYACFNGHAYGGVGPVDMETGKTNYPPCPKCGELVQQVAIEGLSKVEAAHIGI